MRVCIPLIPSLLQLKHLIQTLINRSLLYSCAVVILRFCKGHLLTHLTPLKAVDAFRKQNWTGYLADGTLSFPFPEVRLLIPGKDTLKWNLERPNWAPDQSLPISRAVSTIDFRDSGQKCVVCRRKKKNKNKLSPFRSKLEIGGRRTNTTPRVKRNAI